MKPIKTRFEIRRPSGTAILLTYDWEDLRLVDIPQDKEGFPVRHLHLGTEFTLFENEYFTGEGRFKVVDISTFIGTQHDIANAEGGTYNFEIWYTVEEVR